MFFSYLCTSMVLPYRSHKPESNLTIMDYIRVTKDNLEKEHLCCAISNNKDVQMSSMTITTVD